MSVSEGKHKVTNNTSKITISNGYKLFQNIKIQPWTRVNELKSKISKALGVDIKHIRLFFCNTEMLDELTMLDYKVLDTKSNTVI
jgi:hypothetical protein